MARNLRGDVAMRIMTAVINVGSADFDSHLYEILLHGDSRVRLLDVRAQPDYNFPRSPQTSPTDPRRFLATSVIEDGKTRHLRSSVTVTANDAEVDSSAKTIAIHGDSRFVFVKADIEPDDQLG